MVVATGTTNSQTKKRAAGCDNHVVNCICTNLGRLDRILITDIIKGAHRQEADAHHIRRIGR